MRHRTGTQRVGAAGARGRHLAGILVLLAAMAYSAGLRIHYTLADPNFDRHDAASLLSTDPAFLYYVTERIVESGGRPPADFRADPNVEYPALTDLATLETVGQEFYLAWGYLLFGRGLPLHVFCVWAMGIFASLAAVGVYGLALEITRKVRWACVACLLWAVMLGNYRTLGFVLIREDFALPWFCAHAYLLARAARVRTSASFALAGASLVAAAATWHAMVFVLLMEVACVLLWFLRTGRNPCAERGAWVLLGTAIGLSLLVPVLRAKLFFLSAPMQVALALAGAGLAARRLALSRAAETALALAGMALLYAAASGLSALVGSGLSDYGHVFELMAAKVRYLGVQPEDPGALTFGARLLWQGPFRTAEPATLVLGLTAACLALAAALVTEVPGWITARGEGLRLLLFAFTAEAAAATYLVERCQPILGFSGAVLAVALLDRLRPAWLAALLAAGGVLGHGVYQIALLERWQNFFYLPPRNQERALLAEWISENIPEGKPIAAEFTTSAAILAHTRRPVLQQPKYETLTSRERIERFFDALFRGSVDDVRRYLHDHGSRILVLDRLWLVNNLYLAGLTSAEFAAATETAAWSFLSPDPAVYAQIPGFRLVYTSLPEHGYDPYRVYVME